MKLYEVNNAINELIENSIDLETGEFLVSSDEFYEQITNLQLERQRILEYVAKVILNNKAECLALKEEEQRLKKRRDILERKSDRLLDLLDRECQGQKTNLGVATLSYRNSSRVEILDNSKAVEWLIQNKHSECVKTFEPEVSKSDVRRLLDRNIEVPFVSVVKTRSYNLR